MTVREVLQRLLDACDRWDEKATTLSEQNAAHAEYVNSYAEARAYLAQPEPQDEARDAARYRWLLDYGDLTWTPLAKRCNAVVELEQYIDAAIAAQEKESAK